MNTSPIHKAKDILKTQTALAKACSVSQPTVWAWLKGESKPRGENAKLIEIATGGLVTRQELRPDIFN